MILFSIKQAPKLLLPALAAVILFSSACQQTSVNSQTNKPGPVDEVSSDQDLSANQENSVASNTNSANTESPKNGGQQYPVIPAAIMEAKMLTLDGKVFKLADYKGKILIVNLWASWCGPCRMEMPELVKISQEYKEKGIEVVGLTVEEREESEAMVKTFAARQQVPYRLGWADETVMSGFMQGYGSIPQSFVINGEGKLIAVFRGFNPTRTPLKLRETLDKALNLKS